MRYDIVYLYFENEIYLATSLENMIYSSSQPLWGLEHSFTSRELLTNGSFNSMSPIQNTYYSRVIQKNIFSNISHYFNEIYVFQFF